MSRRKSREMALQALFQIDLSGVDAKRALDTVFSENETEDSFTRELVEGTTQRLSQIDEKIEQYVIDWKLARMSAVDRNVLRLATFELLVEEKDVPARVAVNEAVELAKKFGTEDSAKFVNGILGAMLK
jgi:N utilization substance protein B